MSCFVRASLSILTSFGSILSLIYSMTSSASFFSSYSASGGGIFLSASLTLFIYELRVLTSWLSLSISSLNAGVCAYVTTFYGYGASFFGATGGNCLSLWLCWTNERFPEESYFLRWEESALTLRWATLSKLVGVKLLKR